MTISVKHSFTSAKADGTDSTLIQPSNWNAEHTITLAAGKVLGRDSSGAGAMQELPLSFDTSGNMSMSATGYFTPAVGTTAQRPGTPTQGMMRFNTSSAKVELYNGTIWGSVGGGATISDTAPSSPAAGDLWWKSDEGQMYVYYTDANSSQWVVANAYAGGAAYLPLAGGTVTGNVGIGVAAGTAKLTVGGNVSVQDGAGYGWAGLSSYVGGSSSSNFVNVVTSSIERLRIDSSGNVGIGTTGPGTNLHVYSATTPGLRVSNTTTALNGYVDANYGVFGTITNHAFILTSNNTERVRIDTSGNVQVGGTTVANTAGYVNSRTNTRAWVRWTGSTGAILSSYNVSSVTRNSAANYTINYTTALANGNNAPIGMTAGASTYGSYGVYMQMTSAPTAASCSVTTLSNGGVAVDCATNCLVVFGD